MTIDAKAYNLAQWAAMSNDPLVQAVTFSLIDCGTAMADVPFVSKKSFRLNGVRWEGNLPTVNWRALNSEPSNTIGTPKPYQEQAFIISNEIDVDKYIVEEENQIGDPRGNQVAAYMKSVAY